MKPPPSNELPAGYSGAFDEHGEAPSRLSNHVLEPGDPWFVEELYQRALTRGTEGSNQELTTTNLGRGGSSPHTQEAALHRMRHEVMAVGESNGL